MGGGWRGKGLANGERRRAGGLSSRVLGLLAAAATGGEGEVTRTLVRAFAAASHSSRPAPSRRPVPVLLPAPLLPPPRCLHGLSAAGFLLCKSFQSTCGAVNREFLD